MNRGIETLPQPAGDRRGFALVTTLLIVLVLSVLAVGIAWLATSEKKITFAESVHVSSTFSADAGGEAAINFVRLSDSPPSWSGPEKTVQVVGTTPIIGSQTYRYAARQSGRTPRIGWESNMYDYNYTVDSRGTASTKGMTGVQLVASRLFKVGY